MKIKKWWNRHVIITILAVLLLIGSYVVGNYDMWKLEEKGNCAVLIAEDEADALDFERVKALNEANAESDEPLFFVNWRQDSNGEVVSTELTRKEESIILTVYGRTDLLFAGETALDTKSKESVLISDKLSFLLFGGVDTVGLHVTYEEKEYEIAGIFENEQPVFVYEMQEGSRAGLDRAIIKADEKSSLLRNVASYQMLCGDWKLVDYTILSGILNFFYFMILFNIGIMLLWLIKKYEIEARKQKTDGKINSVREFWGNNKNWLVWQGIFIGILVVLIVMTLQQVHIPEDMIPDKWSNFEFWSKYWKTKKESFTLIKSMAKGIYDTAYMREIFHAVKMWGLSLLGEVVFILNIKY